MEPQYFWGSTVVFVVVQLCLCHGGLTILEEQTTVDLGKPTTTTAFLPTSKGRKEMEQTLVQTSSNPMRDSVSLSEVNFNSGPRKGHQMSLRRNGKAIGQTYRWNYKRNNRFKRLKQRIQATKAKLRSLSSSEPKPDLQTPAITKPVIQLRPTSKRNSNYDKSIGSLLNEVATEQIGKFIGGLKLKTKCDKCKKCNVGVSFGKIHPCELFKCQQESSKNGNLCKPCKDYFRYCTTICNGVCAMFPMLESLFKQHG